MAQYGIVDHVAEFSYGGKVGYGLLEHGFFGPYRHYGLMDGAMGHPPSKHGAPPRPGMGAGTAVRRWGMPDAVHVLADRLQAAFDTVSPGADPVLRPSDRADFQANGALALGKQLGAAPREVAEQVVVAAELPRRLLGRRDQRARLHQPDPGRRLHRPAHVAAVIRRPAPRGRSRGAAADGPDRLLLAQRRQGDARRAPAHHDHGDALAHLSFQGRTVLRENHIGDWGTPFGMLIEHLLNMDGAADGKCFGVPRPERVLRPPPAQFDSDPSFASAAADASSCCRAATPRR